MDENDNSIYPADNSDGDIREENEVGIAEQTSENDVSAPVAGEPVVPVVTSVKKKKDNRIQIIIALCIVCAVVGGAVGGVISGLIISKKSQKTVDTTVSSVTSEYTDESKADEKTTAENTTNVVSGSVTPASATPVKDKTLSAKEIYLEYVSSVVGIETKIGSGYSSSSSFGTGFIITSDGYIVTNYHVVEGGSKYIVTLYDDAECEATLVGYEDTNDLAVLKIDSKDLPSVVYGKSSSLFVGDGVYIIGNPLGDLTYTLTTGVVSALNRLVHTDDGTSINMFQTDAAINSGNSGGPVFDNHGYVVGIASAKYAASSIEGLSFCIPIDDVRNMIDDIINHGYVSGKPLMGVSVYDTVTSNYGMFQSSKKINGAKVAAVGNNNAAVKSGIKTDDIITAVNSTEITSVSSLKTVISGFKNGDTVTLTVTRNNSSVKLKMTFDEYEPATARTSYSNVYDL